MLAQIATAALFASGALASALERAPAPSSATLRPTPAPAPVLEGVVKASDGRPVEGAWVLAAPTLRLDGPPPSTRTREDGRSRLVLERAAPHAVRVYARGYASALLDAVTPGKPLAITLEKGRTIEGRVLDSASGRPVPDARVWTRVGRGLTWEPSAGLVETRTDAKGRFRLEGLGRGAVDLAAEARAYGRGTRPRATAGGPAVEIVLLPGGAIVGAVTDPQRRPLASAVVRLEPSEGWRAPAIVTTDAEGRFEFAGLEPRSYSVVARHPGFAPGFVPGVVVEPDSELSVEVALDSPGAIAGRLVDEEVRPVAGLVLVAEANGSPTPPSLREVLRAQAGPDGRILLEGLPPGPLSIQAGAPALVVRRLDLDVPRGTPLDLGDVVLEAGLAIRGRVRDAAGSAIGDARVFSASPTGERAAETWTEPDGRFVVGGLQHGAHRVTVRAPGFAVAQKTVEAGAEGVEVVLTRGGTVTGRVVDESGRAVESFDVWADAPDEPGAGYERVESAEGRFTLTEAPEGEYVLRVDAPGRATAVVSGVKVRAGADTDIGRIRLTRGGVVRGRVTDAEGAPIAGATVDAEGPGGYGSAFLAVKSDLAGSFEISGVPEGIVHVSASHPRYAPGRVDGVPVEAARGPAEVTIVLTQGGRVEGTARYRDGSPVAGASVQIQGGAQRTTPIGPDGRFGFDRVRPGSGFLILLQQREGRRRLVARRAFHLQEGDTALVDFVLREVLVTGHVTRGGAPVAGVRIHFTGEYGGFATTGAEGRYELTLGAPGPHEVRVETADGLGGTTVDAVEVPDQDLFLWDVDLSRFAPVSGTVVDAETGAPVAQAQVSAGTTGNGMAPATRTQSDGRFELLVEPGDRSISVFALGFIGETRSAQVSAGGLSGLEFRLARGAVIKGRVLDPAGHPVQGLEVVAGAGSVDPSHGYAETLADGSFQLKGLRKEPHTLAAGNGDIGFAWKAGIVPGGPDVDIRLQPSVRVRLRVLGSGSEPVAGAGAWVESVDGVPMNFVGRGSDTTDAAGVLVLGVPTGSVGIVARKDDLEGRVRVDVRPEEPVEAEIRLAGRTDDR